VSAAALAFEGVGVELGGRRVLDDVSLAAWPGEVLTLAGPNGAGKTTLFRVATRIVRPGAGRVTVFGTPLEELSQRALARELAVVPHRTRASPFPSAPRSWC
jgi:iron complex transport system ATP-binding protein